MARKPKMHTVNYFNFHKSLVSAIKQLGDEFERDELAYLAATSKAESPIRDRLAWLIHKENRGEIFVSREWRRSDIGIIWNNLPIALIEAKALYSFDVLVEKNCKSFITKIRSDAEKMKKLSASDRYLLSIIVDISGEIDSNIGERIVKYSKGIRSAATRHGSSSVEALAHARWLSTIDENFHGSTTWTRVDAGEVWGLKVRVNIYLTRLFN